MTVPGFMSLARWLSKARLDVWSLVMLGAIGLLGLLLVWPIGQVLVLGFLDAQTQTFTLGNYQKILTHPYYLGALKNTLIVGGAWTRG